MGRRRGVLLLALVLVLAMVPLSHANACSCIANTDPRDRLAAAEGAFIGELVGRRETGLLGSIISSGRDVVYTFEVAEVFKGDLGQRVDVHSAAGGGSCGFEVAPGEAVGVLLYRHQGTWQSGLCGQIEPDKLRAAAAPLPAPDGQAPAALVVGGSFGEARLLALDRHARTLAYGYGAGRTTQLSVCPGGDRMLEVVDDHPRPSRLALWELPELRLLWERRLPAQPPSISAQSVQCLDGTGTGYVFASNGGDPRWSPQATLLRVSHEAGRNPYDRQLSDLIGELSTRSEEFRGRWAAHHVQIHTTGTKRFHHPVVGDLELAFESFPLAADPSQSLLTYTAEPGSPSQDALNLLASWAATTDDIQEPAGTDNSEQAESVETPD